MLDWIFEGIIGWVSGIISSLMDAVSGLFLEALGMMRAGNGSLYGCIWTRLLLKAQWIELQNLVLSTGMRYLSSHSRSSTMQSHIMSGYSGIG